MHDLNANAIVRPPRLADTLSVSLQSWVRAGRLHPGDQLPTEKQLADQFGVSRAVVREAIARLKAEGYVETRQGRGAFVAPLAGRANFRINDPGAQAPDASLREIFELRCVMESGVAELAALRRQPADLAALGEALASMDEALRRGAQAADDDDAFHGAIAAATHNPLFERFMEFMGAQMEGSRVPTWSPEGHVTGRAAAAQEGHKAIFAAIRDGDAEAARRAAGEHLRSAARRLGMDIGGADQAGPQEQRA